MDYVIDVRVVCNNRQDLTRFVKLVLQRVDDEFGGDRGFPVLRITRFAVDFA